MKQLLLSLILLSSIHSQAQSADTSYIDIVDIGYSQCGYAYFDAGLSVESNDDVKIIIDWGDGSDTTIYDGPDLNTYTPQHYFGTYSPLIHQYATSGNYTITLESRSVISNAILTGPTSLTNYFCGLDVSGTENLVLINNFYYWPIGEIPFENIALDFKGVDGTVITRYTDTSEYLWFYDSINVINYPMTVSLNEQWSANHHLYQITPNIHFTAPNAEDTSDWFYGYFNEYPHIMIYSSDSANVNTIIGGGLSTDPNNYLPPRIQIEFTNDFLAKPDSLIRIHLESDPLITFDVSDLLNPVTNGNSVEFSVINLNMHKPIYIPFILDSANANYGDFLINAYIKDHSDSSALDDSLHFSYEYVNPCGGFTDSVFQLSSSCGLSQCDFGPCYFLNVGKNICAAVDSVFYTIQLPNFLYPDTNTLIAHNAEWNNNTIQGWTTIPQYQTNYNLQFFLRIDSTLVQNDTNFTIQSIVSSDGQTATSSCSMNLIIPNCNHINLQFYGVSNILVAPTQSGSLSFEIGELYNCPYGDDVWVTVQFPGYVTPNIAGLSNASFTDSTLIFSISYPFDYQQISLSIPGTIPAGTPYQITISFTSPGDVNPTDNTFIALGTVLNSYDPNEKIVDLPVQLDPTIQDQLNYTIHFQNEGNLPATNIVVLDFIDEHLDLSSFHFIGAKHYCDVSIDPGTRVATFSFPNINLAPKSVSEDSSQSILTYIIKELPTNGIGDGFENTAYIYFDFNPPIVTNTTYNVNTSLSVGTQNIENITIYPNPTKNNLFVKGDDLEYLTIIDLIGKIILNQELTNSNSVDVENLTNGTYTCVITSKNGVSRQKLVIEK